jgi:translation elongation factor EF-1alpha
MNNMQAKVILQDVYKITGIGVVPVVIVQEGTLKPGMKLVVQGREMTINSMEQRHKSIQTATSGYVGLSISNADYDLLNSLKGKEVIFSEEGIRTKVPLKAKPNHPKGAFSFITDLFKK